MYDNLIRPFADNEFMWHALLAGVLVSAVCALVGTFVVLRGMSFVGDALAHGVLPGVATATIIGVSPIVGAFVGAGVMMGGVAMVSKRTRLSSDTAIGLMFVLMLSVGVMIISKSDDFRGDLTQVLFGEILAVSTARLIWLFIAFVAVGAIVFVARRPFLLSCMDADLVRTSGFSPVLTQLLLHSLIGVTVVASFNAVGTLLVFGMLVAPAATGALLARRLSTMMLIAFLVGSVSSYVGLAISYHADVAAGATIVVVAVGVFLVVMTAQEIVRARKPREIEVGHHVHSHDHDHAGGLR